ncbi:hypothetical protein BKA62DRAFT_380461 [Auriculariales sp. MPI-PUGE-AT-0066]|nr:hypothetical protein BKA62DRAFT_380461 [Auriculariales sp. MPI-PUGE-AT-0066]
MSADPARQPLLPPPAHADSNGAHAHPQQDSSRKRFLKTLGIGVLVLLLTAALLSSITDWPFSSGSPSSPGKHERRKPVAEASHPPDVDGEVIACYPHQSGLDFHDTHRRWKDTALSGARARTARATIDFPLDLSQVVNFIARGGAVEGTVVIEDANSSNATARVEVEWDPSMITKSPYLFEVCELYHYSRGAHVLGLYLPEWAKTAPRQFTPTQVVLTISVPPGLVKSLRTETWLYTHDLRVSNKTTFSNVDLNSYYREISGQLSGESLALRSVNAPISGNYTASRKLSLHTSNAAIDTQLVLGSSSVTVPTLNIGTTHGSISGAVRLVDAHSFDGVLRTTDAGIDFALATLPLNGKVTLDAQTSNAPARLALPATYEGVIVQSATGGGMPELTVPLMKDPAGLGRLHEVATVSHGKHNRTDRVSWGPVGGRGKVTLGTSNAAAGVDITENWK